MTRTRYLLWRIGQAFGITIRVSWLFVPLLAVILAGAAAVDPALQATPVLLALVMFLWTPPHFWALAIRRREEYAKAEIPMLPVTHGVMFTKLQILLYTILLFIVTLMPFLVQMSGLGFSLVEIVSNCPTNWGIPPAEATNWLEKNMLPYYPLGIFKTPESGSREPRPLEG